MKLNKKLIIFFSVIMFISIVSVYIFGSSMDSNSLGLMELVFLALVCLLFGLIINILFIIVSKVIKSIN